MRSLLRTGTAWCLTLCLAFSAPAAAFADTEEKTEAGDREQEDISNEAAEKSSENQEAAEVKDADSKARDEESKAQTENSEAQDEESKAQTENSETQDEESKAQTENSEAQDEGSEAQNENSEAQDEKTPAWDEQEGIVRASSLHVRAMPSLEGKILGSLANGTRVTICRTLGTGWLQIAYGTGKAFVSAAYVVLLDDAGEGEIRIPEEDTYNKTWDGPVLNPIAGIVEGPSGLESYYNLDMSGIIATMREMGNNDEYWIRSDGVKMLGNYIMCAANLSLRPRGTLVESSLGTCIVCDTGGFASYNPTQLDIAVTW